MMILAIEHRHHYILKENAHPSDIDYLKWRTRLNPDLEYFVTRLDEGKSSKDIIKTFKFDEKRVEPNFMKL